MSTTRNFIAIPLPQTVVQAITNLQNKTEQSHPNLYRWTPVQNLHLTLYFLGDSTPDQLQSILTNLQNLTYPEFSLQPHQILRLPEPNVPKILALSLTGDLPQLKKLQQAIHDSVFNLATHKETRPFLPHITMGRLKKDVPPSAKPVKRLIASLPNPPGTQFTVQNVHTYQSTLSKQGPSYDLIATYSPTNP